MCSTVSRLYKAMLWYKLSNSIHFAPQPLSFHLCCLHFNQLVHDHKDLVILTTMFYEGGHGDTKEWKAESVHLHEGS